MIFRIFDNRATRAFSYLRFIPPAEFRFGGQQSLVEYAYTAGLFSGLIATHTSFKDNLHNVKINVLDFGCGTGKLTTSVLPFVHSGGRMIGIDLGKREIAFCRSYYPSDICSFYRVPAMNLFYNPDGKPQSEIDWHVSEGSTDVVLALSVFTHLNEEDAHYYMKKIDSILKTDGIAILTFFLLDKYYDIKYLKNSRWIFDVNYPKSTEWRSPGNIKVPEAQIGVTIKGLNSLIQNTNLSIEKIYQGTWKNVIGPFLQDIVILKEKAT